MHWHTRAATGCSTLFFCQTSWLTLKLKLGAACGFALSVNGFLPRVLPISTRSPGTPHTCATAARCSSRLTRARFWSSRCTKHFTASASPAGSSDNAAENSRSSGDHAAVSTAQRSTPVGRHAADVPPLPPKASVSAMTAAPAAVVSVRLVTCSWLGRPGARTAEERPRSPTGRCAACAACRALLRGTAAQHGAGDHWGQAMAALRRPRGSHGPTRKRSVSTFGEAVETTGCGDDFSYEAMCDRP
eukprot:365812-Chlamydomonas_euryale.AAC.4